MPVSVRRPKAIVFDILGTASKSGFLEKVLFPFLRVNIDNYVNTHWAKKDFLRLYDKIMNQSIEFHQQEPSTPIVLTHDNPQAKQSFLAFINFVTDNGVNSPPVSQLRFKVWFEGYQQSKLHTPIYSDVPKRCRQWFAEGVKFYVFSNTWIEAQKALLKNTNHGDLTNLISGHYDNDFGPITDPESWRRLCAEIHENPNEVLFLTKSSIEAHAASEAGVAVVLVLTHRHNVKAISREDRTRFAYVRTLNDLNWLEGSMMPTPSASQVGPGTDIGTTMQGPVATATSAATGGAPISTGTASASALTRSQQGQSSAGHGTTTTQTGGNSGASSARNSTSAANSARNSTGGTNSSSVQSARRNSSATNPSASTDPNSASPAQSSHHTGSG